MSNINENILQTRGRATLSEPLKIGSDYNLMLSVNCDKVEEVDLQDGTFNMVYKVKPTGVVDIIDDKGQKLTGNPKRSLSQQWRIFIETIDSYEIVMEKMLRNRQTVYDFISKLD